MNPRFARLVSLLSFFGGAAFAAGCAHSPPRRVPFVLGSQYAGLPETERLRFTERKDLTTEEALLYTNERLQTLREFQTPQIDPYSGKSSRPAKCLAGAVPAEVKRDDATGFMRAIQLYSSPNLVLGACPASGAVKSQQVFLYCRGERVLYVISVFLLEGQNWPLDTSIRCHP